MSLKNRIQNRQEREERQERAREKVEAVRKKREERQALEEYRRAQANRTPEQVAEERAEARAAMGEGVEMVNVLTGERWTT